MVSRLEDFEAIFGDDFVEIIAKYQAGITVPLENLLIQIIDTIMLDTNVFTTNLESAILNMQSSGMSMEFIASSLENDLLNNGKIFGQLKNSIKSSVVRGINQSSRLGQYQKYFTSTILANEKGVILRDQLKFQWVTVTGHKICVDCQGRQGQVLTFDEWEREGVPGSGATVCGAYCYCVLDPMGSMDKEIVVPKDVEPEKNFSA